MTGVPKPCTGVAAVSVFRNENRFPPPRDGGRYATTAAENPVEDNPYSAPASENEAEAASRPLHALAWLFIVLVIVFLGTSIVPRITPPGGLVAFDFLLMFALPAGAYRAGKEWYCGPIFLMYGAIGMFLFIPGYLSDGRLKFKVATQAAVVSHVVWWCLGVSLVAAASWWAGRIAQSATKHHAESDHNG